MISQLQISRSRSDSRPRPIQVPGRSTKVRSLIDFYNQKALQKAMMVTSRPYNDLNRIPSDKVRSLVQNFSKTASAASGSGPSSRGGMPRDGTSSPVAFRNGRGSHIALRNGTTSPIALRGNFELATGVGETGEVPGYHPRSTGLRTVGNWKPSRFQEQIMLFEPGGYVARNSTRRKETFRHAFVKDIVNSKEGVLPPKQIQPLTAPVLRALESEITRSSSLEMGISASLGDVTSDGESAFSQTSESSSRKFRERREAETATDTEVKTSNIEPETDSVGLDFAPQQALSTVPRRSGSWKVALRTMRDTFRKRPSTAESSLSTKVSHESAPAYKPEVIKSLTNNLTPDSPATSYLTAPDYLPNSLRASSQTPISSAQAQVQKLKMLETVISEPENENILPNDKDTQKNLSNIDADQVLQEVSGPSLSQPVEDPNTISGMGEMASWDSTIARQKKRARAYKTFSKHRKGDRMPVAGVFRPMSPVQRRESPLKPISPLRITKEKKKATSQGIDETVAITNPARDEPSVLLTRASMDTLTSFKELSLSGSPSSSIEAQNEQAQVGASLDAVELMFESLSDLHTPPPSRPLQKVRSPTVMREMAFPSLRLRESYGDASIKKKKYFIDTPVTTKPAPKNQAVLERKLIPKKMIFGDADWRMDRRMSGNNNADEINRKLRELQESSPSSYDGQTTNSVSVERGSDFAILPRQNYILPVPEIGDPGEGFSDMIESEAPFLKYTINPPLPAGTLPPYPLYQINREFTPQPLVERASVIDVGADEQDEMFTRGRRRKRIGS